MNQSHDAPKGERQELLYDASIPTPSHAERARTLVATAKTGTLCTLAKDPAGYPYGSFVTFALDQGEPVFLISALAEHTRNVKGDPRASLLVAEPPPPEIPAGEEDDPLARGRVTLLGRMGVLASGEERDRAKEAYLAAHPNASYYVDFKDFAIWKLALEAVRYIGGFGRMSWVDRAAFLAASPDPIAPIARGILAHMNKDHAGAMVEYVLAYSRARDVTSAVMLSCDRYGFEMAAETPAGPRPIRVAFPRPVATGDEVRKEMIALLEKARASKSATG